MYTPQLKLQSASTIQFDEILLNLQREAMYTPIGVWLWPPAVGNGYEIHRFCTHEHWPVLSYL